MVKVNIHIEAEKEIITASRYYEEQVRGLGDKFLDDLQNAIDQITRFPKAWTIYAKPYRRYLLRHFPYGIIYRTGIEQIFIIAVAHLQRKPYYWKNR